MVSPSKACPQGTISPAKPYFLKVLQPPKTVLPAREHTLKMEKTRLVGKISKKIIQQKTGSEDRRGCSIVRASSDGEATRWC